MWGLGAAKFGASRLEFCVRVRARILAADCVDLAEWWGFSFLRYCAVLVVQGFKLLVGATDGRAPKFPLWVNAGDAAGLFAAGSYHSCPRQLLS